MLTCWPFFTRLLVFDLLSMKLCTVTAHLHATTFCYTTTYPASTTPRSDTGASINRLYFWKQWSRLLRHVYTSCDNTAIHIQCINTVRCLRCVIVHNVRVLDMLFWHTSAHWMFNIVCYCVFVAFDIKLGPLTRSRAGLVSCLEQPEDYNMVQLGTKVCTQAYTSLYIAIQVSIPSCYHIMTQHVSGDHTVKFESALESSCQQGIASCFCLAQQSEERRCVCRCHCLCLQSQSQKVSQAALWQKFCTWQRLHWKQGLAGSTVFALAESEACSTSKLSGFLWKCSSSQYFGLLERLDTRQESWPVLPDSTSLSRSGCLWLLLAAVHQRSHAHSRFQK